MRSLAIAEKHQGLLADVSSLLARAYVRLLGSTSQPQPASGQVDSEQNPVDLYAEASVHGERTETEARP